LSFPKSFYKKNIIYFIIERKTIQDYANSIRDGRYREQKQRLLSNYTLSQIIYLIEGDFCDYHKLNFSKIKNDILNTMYNNYSKLIPEIGKFVVGKKEPYEYLVKSIENFVNQDELIDLMKKKNFKKCNYRNLSGGIVSIHSGWKV